MEHDFLYFQVLSFSFAQSLIELPFSWFLIGFSYLD